MTARGAAWAAGLAGLAGLAGGGCDTDLSTELAGLACRPQAPRCLPGYVCAAGDRCVRAGSEAGGGAGAGGGGTGGESPDAGPGSAGAGGGGAGGSSGAAADAGSAGFRYDAGPGLDALDASVLPDAAGCAEPVPLFRDEDEDGYGITAQQVPGCPPQPQWALQGGDCRDDLPDVHPEQETFFASGYPDPTRPAAGNVSFDYDCNVTEEPLAGIEPAPACNQLLTCAGDGYLAIEPPRAGPGVNAICGSTQLVACQATTILGLACAAEPLAGAAPARCR